MTSLPVYEKDRPEYVINTKARLKMPLEIIGMPQEFCPERCSFMRLGNPHLECNMFGTGLEHIGSHTLRLDEMPSHTFGAERYPAHYRPKLNCIFENVCKMWAERKEDT